LPGNQELLLVAAIRATEFDAEAEGVVRSVATLNAVSFPDGGNVDMRPQPRQPIATKRRLRRVNRKRRG
jgi:hypothetical protein